MIDQMESEMGIRNAPLVPKHLHLDDEDLGVIHASRTVGTTKMWLTERPDETWWVIVKGDTLHTIGFVRPPQEMRARQVYDSLAKPEILQAMLEGRDS